MEGCDRLLRADNIVLTAAHYKEVFKEGVLIGKYDYANIITSKTEAAL